MNLNFITIINYNYFNLIFFNLILFLTLTIMIFYMNEVDFISVLLYIDLLLLVSLLNFIYFSIVFFSIQGVIYAFLLLAIAAAETAIGLSLCIILHSFYPWKNLNLNTLNKLRF